MNNLPRPFFVLAPMDDVTDVVFRQIVAPCEPPDVFFTEFTNVDGLQSIGRQKLLPRLRLEQTNAPVVLQIWGKNPENFYKTAREIVDGSLVREANGSDTQTFAAIDINFGCPEKNVVRNNTCSAMIKPENWQLAAEIIKATREGVAGSIPVSVKTRLGFNEVDFSWHEHLLRQDIFMLTVHGRTRKEMSKVPARWEQIAEVVTLRDRIAPSTLIVGNGDVMNRSEGLLRAKESGVDGVMIGRGVFQDPYCFAADSPWANMGKIERIALFRKHVELFSATWHNNERRFEPSRKFAKIYISGFDGASELRERIMALATPDEVLTLLDAIDQ